MTGGVRKGRKGREEKGTGRGKEKAWERKEIDGKECGEMERRCCVF